MALLSNKAILKVAKEIEPYIDELVESIGVVTSKDIIRLAKEHGSHAIHSRRSVMMVLEYLCL